MKYYEILPTHTETPRNTTRKIANLYIEFNYHFLTLQKKIPLLLNRSVRSDALVLKRQAMSIHSADYRFIVLDQFHTEILHLDGITYKINFIWKKNDPIF